MEAGEGSTLNYDTMMDDSGFRKFLKNQMWIAANSGVVKSFLCPSIDLYVKQDLFHVNLFFPEISFNALDANKRS